MECKYCHRRKASRRARGLCWACSQVPAIRDLFPLSPECAKFRKRGLGMTFARSAESPSAAMPGSEEKICVMAARAELGQEVFHAGDVCCRRITEAMVRLRIEPNYVMERVA